LFKRRLGMKRVLVLVVVGLVGAAIVRQVMSSQRFAEFREKIAHMPEECDCPCHSAGDEETPAAEKTEEELAVG
jgi:hypothetical protein